MRSRMATASVVFFSTFDFISVFARIGFKEFLPLDCALNICVGNRVLLRQTVCQDCDLTAMKEVKDPILHVSLFSSQFINSVSQVIGCRASEFVSELGQKLDASAAVRPGPLVASTQVL